MKGLNDFSNLKNHTIIIGWIPEETPETIRLLREDREACGNGLVLVDSILEEKPIDGVWFVKSKTLTSEADLIRAGVKHAKCVLIHTGSDRLTMSAAMAVNALSVNVHLVAHFKSTEKANLARRYIPSLECTADMSTEMLVRSAQDPGSSHVITELLRIDAGATQFAHVLPDSYATTFGVLFTRLKAERNAVLIGYKQLYSNQIEVNPDSSTHILGGTIYYIGDDRLPSNFIS